MLKTKAGTCKGKVSKRINMIYPGRKNEGRKIYMNENTSNNEKAGKCCCGCKWKNVALIFIGIVIGIMLPAKGGIQVITGNNKVVIKKGKKKKKNKKK